MEVTLWFILLLFVNSGYGVSQTVYLSGNQTWSDASNDNTCPMLGMDLTGDIANDIDNISSTVLGTHQTAWIGAYAKRVWINFQGCYFGIFKHNDNGKAVTSPGDPAKECLRFCNYSRFILTRDRCVCYKDVTLTTSGCIAGECHDTKYTYCGRGTAINSQNIRFHCMCQFSMETNTSDVSGDGNCLAVTYKPQQQFVATNCSEKYQPLCYRPTQTTKFFTLFNTFDWLHALSGCYMNNSQFASTSIGFGGLVNVTYWIGGFAVTYTLWGHPPSTNDGCMSVNITNNHLIPVVLSCGTLLPALCVNTSVSTQITTELSILDTTSIITTDGVTPNQQITTDTFQDTTSNTYHQTTRRGQVGSASTTNGQGGTSKSDRQTTTSGRVPTVSSKQLSTTHYQDGISNYHLATLPSSEKNTHKHKKSPSTSPEQSFVPTVVGSVAGGVAMLIIIVVVILLLRRRGVFKKFPAAKNSSEGDDIEMRKPDKVDHSYTEIISTSDNVYNHLGELKTEHNVSGEDLYDHTGDQSVTYGQLHTHNNKYDDDSEYDHTFNHTARDTYGNLNSVYIRDDDSEYDHTFNYRVNDTYGHLNSVCPRDDNNEYGHVFTGTSVDIHGRLHTGK